MSSAWFDETRRKLEGLFFKEGIPDSVIYSANQVSSLTIHNRQVIFAEHYPLLEKEQILYNGLQLSEVTVYSSLDEPLFRKFGGDKIISLMERMGATENESFTHSTISASIRNAQQKVSNHVTMDQFAVSQEDWLMKNVPPIS